MDALSRFYRDVTWEGVICEGGMGPGTPAMTGMGRATARAVYRGRIDGDRLIFESLEDAGGRLRLTWDASDPDVIIWRNEMTTGAGTWFLIEEYRMVPR
jgi:hypothetical protein